MSTVRSAGRSTAVLLAGDAGVGKTRLLDELTARAAERGVRVLTGHCVDLGDVGLPYLPFVDLLRPVAADPTLAPESAANPALAGLLAGRPGALPVVPPPAEGRDLGRPLPNRAAPQPADDGRLQLFESVAGLICELAAAGPLLLVLEDLHWADRSSRDLLRYLLARLVDEPVAVVASYRSDDLHRRHPLRPLLAELVRLPVVERLELAPLRRRRGRRPRRAGWPARCPSAPSTTSSPAPRATRSTPRNCSPPACRARPCRSALTDVLLARVEQRSPATQQVLRIAAAAGRRVRHEWVAAVGGLAPAELDQALAEAVHHHLLVVSDDLPLPLPPRAAARGGARRPAARRAGPAARRDRRLPAQHARAPGRRPSWRTTRGRATTCPAAFEASLEAAADACRVGAPAEQLQHLETALALWSAVPDAAERAGREQAAVLLETAVGGTDGGGAAPRRSPCCARRWSCSGTTAIPRRAPGCTTRWPRRWCGWRTTRPRTGRAAPRWRWCRRSRRRRCAPGRRPRTRG